MQFPSLDDHVRKNWRLGDAWTVEELHEAVRTFKPRFLILPPDFPVDLLRLLFVTDPEISRWSRYPTVLFRSNYTNVYYLANHLFASRTVSDWRRILGALKSSSVPGDQAAADAIAQVLRSHDGLDPDREEGVKLAVPEDWLDRVERIEVGLATGFD